MIDELGNKIIKLDEEIADSLHSKKLHLPNTNQITAIDFVQTTSPGGFISLFTVNFFKFCMFTLRKIPLTNTIQCLQC